MVGDTVCIQSVSAANSLIYGNLQGIFDVAVLFPPKLHKMMNSFNEIKMISLKTRTGNISLRTGNFIPPERA